MTPIDRPYCNWDAVARVMATFAAMLAEGNHTSSRALVLLIIAKHCNQENGISLASYDMLWDEAGVPRRTASDAVTRLVKDGYLRRTGTYTFLLGDKVQTFTDKKPSGAKKANQQAVTTPPASNRFGVKFEYK